MQKTDYIWKKKNFPNKVLELRKGGVKVQDDILPRAWLEHLSRTHADVTVGSLLFFYISRFKPEDVWNVNGFHSCFCHLSD